MLEDFNMDFFDKLGKTASKTYNMAAEKTGKLAREAKLKIVMSENKSKIEDLYLQIGKVIYENHIREEKQHAKEEVEAYLSKIDDLAQKIEEARKEILTLSDKKQCPNCSKEIEKESNYCPNCGVKQEKEQSKEDSSTEKEEKRDDIILLDKPQQIEMQNIEEIEKPEDIENIENSDE